jgi:hypothetical protein
MSGTSAVESNQKKKASAMMSIYNNTKMFSAMTRKQRAKLQKHVDKGGAVEFRTSANEDWSRHDPLFAADRANMINNIQELNWTVRAIRGTRLLPLIDWNEIPKEFCYLASNVDNQGFLYVTEPVHTRSLFGGYWDELQEDHRALMSRASYYDSFIPGTIWWGFSLTKRPGTA